LLRGDSEEEEVFFWPDFSAIFLRASGTFVSPFVLLDIGAADSDEPPMVQEKMPPP